VSDGALVLIDPEGTTGGVLRRKSDGLNSWMIDFRWKSGKLKVSVSPSMTYLYPSKENIS
jgi:hypothetical protein